jgi:cytochrome b subunit of formate dehydrogenase
MLPVISKVSTKLVHTIEGENGRVYVTLAKLGLWMCSVCLTLIIIGGIRMMISGDTDTIGNVVQACQVLAMIAISVLGYHGYSGTRIFHALRHMIDGTPEPDSKESKE